jgi:hypothetical protein
MKSGSRYSKSLRGSTVLGTLTMLCGSLAYGADISLEQELALREQIAEQTRHLDALRKQMQEADAKLNEIKRTLGIDTLRLTRGGTGSGANRDTQSFELAQASSSAASPASPQAGSVGQAPASSSGDSRPPAIAPIFDQPGVLTPRGKFVLEPGLQYSYSSSNRVSLVGYTIIPALTIGLIDVREVRRNTYTATVTGRWGVTNRFELEAKVPYVYRSDTVVTRPLNLTPSSQDEAFAATGDGIGDIEVTGRYQFNDGGLDRPYYIGSLRLKSRTGKDPFEVLTDDASNPNAHQLQRELPTGSGFYTIQPGLTMLYPTDPAVFFGSISYQYNVKRSNVKGNFTSGEKDLGEIEPGGVFGFNFGMGLALNERSSFSIGYDHSSVGRTRQNGKYALDAVRTELGTLLLGYAYKIDNSRSLNVSVGAGVTRDTPDVTLSMRLPVTF